MERQEEKEKVLVPIRRQETTTPAIKTLPEDPPEPSEIKVPEMPRRWYVF